MYLGIDTSNYTTSVAVFCDGDVTNSRKILPVKEGQRGLRQSDAVFLHIKQMAEVFDAVSGYADRIKAVSVSSKPRNVDGSYMPVFTVGESYGEVLAKALNVPLYKFSHQDGHIMAGIYSCDAWELLNKPFISVHLSGGTTEILLSSYNGYGFDNEIIGGTLDISAGQLIDRVGVALGMAFPCGKEFDAVSLCSENPVKLPVSVKGGDINFSGAETKCGQFFENSVPADICLGVLNCVSEALGKALNYCIEKHTADTVLIAGGVASNSVLRKYINENVKGKVLFASRELSTDNAVGTAILGKLADAERRTEC